MPLFLLLIGLWSLSGTAPYLTFTDTRGFSFDYPQGWERKEQGQAYAYAQPASYDERDFQENVSAIVNKDSVALWRYVASLERNVKAYFEQPGLISKRLYRISPSLDSAALVSYDVKVMNPEGGHVPTVRLNQCIIKRAKQQDYVLITFTANRDSMAGYEQVAAHIMKSIRVD
jgi:hypothetical protein